MQNKKMVQLGQQRLAYTEAGNGPVLLCLHATGHSACDYVAFSKDVSDNFKVIAVDWPGHGASAAPQKPASAHTYAALTEAFLDQLNCGPVYILGNSIGGAAAIILAAKRPDLVRALILSSPGGLEPTTRFTRFAIRLMIHFFKAGEAKKPWFNKAFSCYYRIVLPKAVTRRRQITKSWPETISEIRAAWQSFAEPDADLRETIKQISCRIWLAWSKSDKIVKYQRSKAVIDTFPNATTTLFEGGHCPALEDRKAFIAGLKEFIAKETAT